MTENTQRQNFPVGWLSAHLSRKMLLALVALAVVSWGLMCWCFLAFLTNDTEKSYDGVLDAAGDRAEETAAYWEACGGNKVIFRAYLAEHHLSCAVRGADGAILFERVDEGAEKVLSAPGTADVTLLDGGAGTLTVWVRAVERSQLSAGIRREARIGLTVLNVCVFLVVAVIMYLVVVAPIVRLRKMMHRYYEQGEQPERSERQDEVGKLQNAFADLAGVLECKEKAEHHLIASISHDIKTPLTSVLGYSERLRSNGLSSEKREQYLERVYEKALRIKSVVDEFDDYLDVGLRDTAPMRLLTAGELCERLRAEYAAELSDAGVGFQVECRCPTAQVICNWEHIRRLFGNLIGNSIQHAGASALELHLTCRCEDGRVEFAFRDNGKGVPEELLQQIFEPLYTSDRGRKVSGLGLSICKSMMKAHGGTIRAENAPGGGLCIRCALPEVHF